MYRRIVLQEAHQPLVSNGRSFRARASFWPEDERWARLVPAARAGLGELLANPVPANANADGKNKNPVPKRAGNLPETLGILWGIETQNGKRVEKPAGDRESP